MIVTCVEYMRRETLGLLNNDDLASMGSWAKRCTTHFNKINLHFLSLFSELAYLVYTEFNNWQIITTTYILRVVVVMIAFSEVAAYITIKYKVNIFFISYCYQKLKLFYIY